MYFYMKHHENYDAYITSEEAIDCDYYTSLSEEEYNFLVESLRTEENTLYIE